MKTIGLIGGMSWESSAEYYRLINTETKRRLGGHHNAPSVMVTVDFDEIERLQREGDWDRLGCLMADAARRLERAGADLVVLCTNTMHKVAGSISESVRIPLLHIAEVTGEAIFRAGRRRAALLGTRFTMEEPFYAERILQAGVETIVPYAPEREVIHRVIYEELCHGLIRPESRQVFAEIIQRLAARGADAVILGCTEIGLLISQEDSVLPVFDSTSLHAIAAVEYALA